MRKNRKILITSLFFILISQAHLPAAGAAEKMDSIFAPLDKRDSPGAAVLVMRDGKVIFARGYGMANLEYDVPITPATVFHAASLSKQFTAFAVLLLEDEGKLSLDDDVRKHLPRLPDFGAKITIRHLLLHTSGLRDQWELLLLSGRSLSDVITQEELLRLVYRQRELNFPPGSEFLYCNTGYLLLAEIVARASGQPFTEFTCARIFRPLGMAHTHFHDDCAMIVKNMAYSYDPGAGEARFQKSILSYSTVGPTSLFTTAEDLARWIDNFDAHRVGNEPLLRRLQTPGTLDDGAPLNYAFGLSGWQYRGLDVISHDGADAGYRCAVYRFPEKRFAVVILGNLASINPDRYAQRAADVFLWNGVRETSPVPPPPKTHTVISADPSLYPDYAGRYLITDESVLTVTVENGRLLARETGRGEDELFPEGEDAFFAKGSDWQAVFARDEAGHVHAVRILREGADTSAAKMDEPDLTPDQMLEYCGDYYSGELDVTYSVSLKEGRLTASQLRLGETSLEPTTRDKFQLGWFSFAVLRDADGRVTGALASSGRVKNLKFEKVK